MASAPATQDDVRTQTLLTMYGAMWDNVNRHITVVWQAMAPLLTAAAGEYLADQQLVSRDVAAAAVLFVCAWVVAHVLDASAWCNRNLLIIANIERELLSDGDAHRIHPYFKQRRAGTMLEHLRIQFLFAGAVGLFTLVLHLKGTLMPAIQSHQVIWTNTLPYMVLSVAAVALFLLQGHFGRRYADLFEATNSEEGREQRA